MLYAGPTLHLEVFLCEPEAPSENSGTPLMKLRFSYRAFPIVNVQSKCLGHPPMRFLSLSASSKTGSYLFSVCLAEVRSPIGFLNLTELYSSRILPDPVSYRVHPEGLCALSTLLFMAKHPKTSEASMSPSQVLPLEESISAPLRLGFDVANSPETLSMMGWLAPTQCLQSLMGLS
jgi:hypothetical protein